MLRLKEALILGSQSPRRKELMTGLALPFEVLTQKVEESYDADMNPKEVPIFLSKKKNSSYRDLLKNEILITADTVVLHNGIILEKPKDNYEAAQFLLSMSAKDHLVISGVTVSDHEQSYSFSAETIVTLRRLEKNEVNYYIERYKPFDKAGAYGIQEWLGLMGVSTIKGSFYNVMGLPTDKVYDCLKQYFQLR